MAQPSINMEDNVEAEIDDRRHSTSSRSKWVSQAILVRFLLEDTGEWDELADESRRHFEQLSDDSVTEEAPIKN